MHGFELELLVNNTHLRLFSRYVIDFLIVSKGELICGRRGLLLQGSERPAAGLVRSSEARSMGRTAALAS